MNETPETLKALNALHNPTPKANTMANPFPIDPSTGLVHCIALTGPKEGKVVKLQPIDAREQLFRDKPLVRLADEDEAPPVKPQPGTGRDWSQYTLVQLREFAQDAGAGPIAGRNKSELAAMLNGVNYAPPVGQPDADGDFEVLDD